VRDFEVRRVIDAATRAGDKVVQEGEGWSESAVLEGREEGGGRREERGGREGGRREEG
jgi:hypothetical protein